MIYLRLAAISLWLVVCCLFGLVLCVVKWGDTNLDRVFGRFFAWGARLICSLRVHVEGEDHMESRKPCVYVANHQSGLDMATFGTVYPFRTVVVGKKELLYIPFFGLFFKAAGNIVLNRQKRVTAVASLRVAADQIRARQLSVWIFPEGTRNRTTDPMLPFKKGAFYMAIQAGVPIVPVVCAPIGGLVSWKEKRMEGGDVRIRVLAPIETSSYGEKDVDRLADDVRALMIEALRELS
jgi:1-acyl-sn-glycerol-3-phosphate acyltransferase